MSDIVLKDNAKIAVVGGGPAGAFFAIHALKEAERLNKKINITIFDPRTFSYTGPKGCNMCAGIIQSELRSELETLDIPLPPEVIQEEIKGYTFCIQNFCTSIFKENTFPITTVFRGGGPGKNKKSDEKSGFDSYLLSEAFKRGAKFINSKVKSIKISPYKKEPVTMFFGRKNEQFTADLLIGAFGINSGAPFSSILPKYKPPKSWHTYQAEIFLGANYIKSRYGKMVHICFIKPKGIKYLAATPKGDYLTVTAIGKNVKINDLYTAISNSEISQYLPDGWKIACYCHPRIPVTSAHRPYDDRIIIIGDAAYSRYLKNGIGSACTTARYAAETVIRHGISSKTIKEHYDKKCRKKFTADNFWGKLLIHFHDLIMANKTMSHSYLSLLIKETQSPTPLSSKKFIYLLKGGNFSDIIWHLYSGDTPYKKIFLQSIHPFLQMKLTLSSLIILLENHPAIKETVTIAHEIGHKNFTESPSFIPLRDDTTVAIIGGGPAGSSCAIALLREAKKVGKKINVVIYEQKDFKNGRHFNQCLGVLSPPILDILKNELDLELDPNIIIKKIKGYVLHSENSEITLKGNNSDNTLAVRRITFDNFMLEQARHLGAKVIQSRVIDLEFSTQHVTVYSEGENCSAQVVVGSFGLDDGSCKIFERNTKYKQPKFLNTIVTKLYIGEKWMANFEPYIHAYLPKDSNIEYAAITPKKDHITVNIVGKKVNSETMLSFLRSQKIQKILPPRNGREAALNFYKGKFPVSQASHLYGNRYVTIGDAAGLIRPFKGKGINSGCLSGIFAAKSIINRGVSSLAFANFYRDCHEITADLPYGKILRFAAIIIKRFSFLDKILKYSKKHAYMEDFLHSCVSAQKSYKESVRKVTSITSIKKILFLVWEEKKKDLFPYKKR